MDEVFFRGLGLPDPKYNLKAGSGTHAEETANMLIGIERILKEESPDLVLLQGDTNTVLAGSLAASKLHIPVGHVEAGLRSFDRNMPEELNRIVADHLSDYLFAPTTNARKNLLKEGIRNSSVYVTGNTIVDVIKQNMALIDGAKITHITNSRPYILCTLHREENVDNPQRLHSILQGLELLYSKLGIDIIYPMHPRTKSRLSQNNYSLPRGLRTTDPLDYITFLKLEQQALLILTDSGGVQEEACILKVPCVTIRENTERPETLQVGANVIAGTAPSRILSKVRLMLKVQRSWPNPFGDGTAAKRIINILEKKAKRSHLFAD